MKKSFLKSLTILLVLSMAMTILVLPSCRSHNTPLISRMDTNRYQVHALQRIDTVLLHDSVYVREVMRGDTVYLTHTEYRDRWRIREVHDTIHNTQYITQTIEHPPEKYVPKFYKWCTIALWAIGLLVMGYWLLKWWLKCRV